MRRPPWSNPPLYNHLLAHHQRPQQSRFTPKKSTVDRILSLRVLIERRREFHQPFLERTGAFVRRSIKCIGGHSGISFTSERFPKRSLRWSVHYTPTQKVLSDTAGAHPNSFPCLRGYDMDVSSLRPCSAFVDWIMVHG